jgi:hypothetical protein
MTIDYHCQPSLNDFFRIRPQGDGCVQIGAGFLVTSRASRVYAGASLPGTRFTRCNMLKEIRDFRRQLCWVIAIHVLVLAAIATICSLALACEWSAAGR